jgi:hypothetical protein
MKWEHAAEIARMDHHLKTGGYVQGTLTLRDYFAIKAMQQLIPMVANDPRILMPIISAVTNDAYRIADAMLEERDAAQ